MRTCSTARRIFGQEQQFLIGVRVLAGTDRRRARPAAPTPTLPTCWSRRSSTPCAREFAGAHGAHERRRASRVVAMGKLGGREMTAASDLDLILLYDFDDGGGHVGRRRGRCPAAQYFARLTQRLIAALSAPTAEGTLYEVDMRLRPSGKSGPVATHIDAFAAYQAKEAWTWEHMALTRARVDRRRPAI